MQIEVGKFRIAGYGGAGDGELGTGLKAGGHPGIGIGSAVENLHHVVELEVCGSAPFTAALGRCRER